MHRQFGIDALATYVPRLYIDLTEEWATVRAAQQGEPSPDGLRSKVRAGIGVQQMAVPDYHEDAATMAAMAALRLIQQQGIDPAKIGLLAVGTETTVDQSKSIAAYVLGMLERHQQRALPHVGAPQFQFACIGATYALEAAINHLRSGASEAPYALVIGTDVSKYPLRSSGECTQGAGAVAMLVSEAPRLLALDPASIGTATRDERDFFRPNWTRNAVVDGKYSIDVYLDLIEAAWHHRAQRVAAAGGQVSRERYEDFHHFLFHTPFPRMAEYAAARIFGLLWSADPTWRSQLEVAGASPALPRREFEKRLRASDLFKREFLRKVEPSLALARRVGNVYSASLYLSLASLAVSQEVDDLDGHRALLFSYGSGASAKVLSGTFARQYRQGTPGPAILAALRQDGDGGRRVALSVAQYEQLHAFREYRPDLPDDVLARLRDGAPLNDADRQAVLHALDHEHVRIADRPASLVPPRDEYVLSRISRGEDPAVTDTGYRYYDWVAG